LSDPEGAFGACMVGRVGTGHVVPNVLREAMLAQPGATKRSSAWQESQTKPLKPGSPTDPARPRTHSWRAAT